MEGKSVFFRFPGKPLFHGTGSIVLFITLEDDS